MTTTDDLEAMSDAELSMAVAREVLQIVRTPDCPGVLMTRVRNDPFVWCDDCGLKVPWDDPVSVRGQGRHGAVPNYASDIAAAWLVVEALRGRELCVEIFAYPDDGGWWCSLDSPTSSRRRFQATKVDSAPRAICLAALRAARAQEPHP